MARVIVFLMLICLWPTSAHAIVLEDLIENGRLESVLNHKKVGYYIGSFDPLHKDHETVAELPVKQGLCDFVIVYPSWGGDSYKVRAHIQIRLDMLFAVFRDHPHVIVTRFPPQKLQEALTVPESGSMQNKEVVRPAFEGMRFIGIIGSDVALQLHGDAVSTFMTGVRVDKKYAEHTLGGCMALPVKSFIVAQRESDDLSSLNGKVCDKEIITTIDGGNDRTKSSTAVKRALKNGEAINSMVSDPVIEIIEKHGLYR